MFRPLAWSKTLAVGFSSLLAITVVPVLMVMWIRGRLKPETDNPFARFSQSIRSLNWLAQGSVLLVVRSIRSPLALPSSCTWPVNRAVLPFKNPSSK